MSWRRRGAGRPLDGPSRNSQLGARSSWPPAAPLSAHGGARLRGLSHRELLPLAFLVLALAVALPIAFCQGEEGVATPADPDPAAAPAPTATPEPSPTPIPDRGLLSPPRGWAVTFYRLLGGSRLADPAVPIPTLDLSFETAPFAEYRDGSWGIEASGALGELAPGRYTVVLSFNAKVRVFVGGSLVAEAADPPTERELRASFVHPGGAASVRIEAEDAPGPFVIRWTQP